MSPHQFPGRAHRARPRLRQRLLAIVLTLSLLFNIVLVPGVAARSVRQETPQNAGESTPDGNVTRLFLPLIQSNATVAASDLTTEVQAASPPIPSGALPAYPPNHMVDGLYQAAGTLPPNYNFEAAGAANGTRPANYDFTAAPYDFGAPPTNHDFEAGTTPTPFPGWTAAGPAGSVTLQQNDPVQGKWARLQSNGTLTSDPFTVDAGAQKIGFRAVPLGSGSSQVAVQVAPGPNYTVFQEIGKFKCSTSDCTSWRTAHVDISNWLGQSVKLKFVPSGVIGIDVVRPMVLLPSYTISGITGWFTETLSDGNINSYAQVGPVGQGYLTTAAFTVDANISLATIQLKGMSSNPDSYRIDVLSAPNFTTVTPLPNGTLNDNWESIQLNLGSWLGQSIKLKIYSANGNSAIAVDDIAVQTLSPANWQVTGDTYLVNDGGNHYVFTNATLTSNPFTVASDVQQFTLRYQGLLANNKFSVKLLYGQNLTDVEILVSSQLTQIPGVWQTLKVAIGHHSGETVKLKLEQINGRFYFDDVGVGERLLPGWQTASADAIATGEDSFGSYVAAEYGGAFSIRSQPISVGLVDGANVEKRYYAVAYNIGQKTGSEIRVFWNNQLNPIFHEEANSPTGYRVSYFEIHDSMGASGNFRVYVKGGKFYSIADNIARQHLNEPFSYKAGIEIDTATGSFGYRMSDLQVESAMPLFFTRYYNGHSDLPGVLGYGWSHSYETRLVFTQGGDAGVVFGSGKEVFFVKDLSTGLFLPADARVHNQLVQNGDGSYTFTIKAAPEPNYTTDMSCSPLDFVMFKIGPQKQTYHFNATGQLTSLQDPNGRTVTLHYDGAGRLESVAYNGAALTLLYNGDGRLDRVVDPIGATAVYGYDGTGNLATVTRSAQGVESYSYNRHRLTSVIDANNHLLFQNNFDEFYRVTQQTDALGKTLAVSYNTPTAGVTRVTEPLGGVHLFYYDAYQRTTDWVAPTGQTTAYIYDAVGNLQKVVDGGFGDWNFTYNNSANLVSVYDPLGNPLQFDYNPQELPVTVTDGNGNVTHYEYDSRGNVTQIQNALETINFAYYPNGNLQSMSNPWRSESYTYYPNDKLQTRTNALGYTWSYSYTQNLQLKSVTDPNGHATRYFYDLAGRMIAIRNHEGKQKEYLYDPAGHLIMAEDELDRQTLWDYNAVGLVEAKIDPAGKVITYTYDANRNMTAMKDANNLLTRYEYDADNRLTKEIDPGERVTQYTYDGCGRMTQQITPLQQSIVYDYDTAGQLTFMRLAADRAYQFQYDGNGNLARMYDPNANFTEYAYDALNRPTTVSDAVGVTQRFGYYPLTRQKVITDALGAATVSSYDGGGRLTSVTDPLGRNTLFGYDPVGNRTVVTDTLGRRESFQYDLLNRPEYYTDKAGRTTQFVYDFASQLKQIIEPTAAATRLTQFDYDGRGLLQSVTNALNQPPTLYFYDDGGRVQEVRDADGLGTHYGYDPVTGLLASVTNRLGKTTTYGHDAAGNVTSITDPLGRTQSSAYNSFNQLVSTTDAAGLVTHFEYDEVGRLVHHWLPGQWSNSYSYNARGWLTSIDNSATIPTTFEYDAVGRRTKVIAPVNNVTQFAYDAAGRLTQMTDALGGIVRYGYDAGDRLTTLTNANGVTTTYGYNALDNLVSVTDPLNRNHSFGYDAFGRRDRATDARGITVNYGFDLLDRMITTTHPGPTTTLVTDVYGYDGLGRLERITDTTGVTLFGYDPGARVTSVTTPQGAVYYGYNDADQRTSMTLPGGRSVGYSYDAAGRLNGLTDWLGRTTSFGYLPEGLLDYTGRPNNSGSTYAYDVAGVLDAISYSPNQMMTANYSYDGRYNREVYQSGAGLENYTLDPLNRLTNVTYPTGDSVGYTYDANGNRATQAVIPAPGSGQAVTTTYSYDAGGQLTSDGVRSYTYDANGNLLSDGVNTYTWDWANRLTGATVNGASASYSYDALGVRVAATENGVASSYLWDRLAPHPQLLEDGAYSYLHAGGPIAQIDATGTRYELLADGLGSIRGVTDASGALVGTAEYDVFGGYRSQTGVTSRFGFTGEYLAQGTGMWHLRARDLHPGLGRFLSADPVQPNAPGTQGFNLYAYVANNPTSWVDPSGFSGEPVNPIPAEDSFLAAANMLSLPAIGYYSGNLADWGDYMTAWLGCAFKLCFNLESDLMGLINQFGSAGANTYQWTIESLSNAFALHPLLPNANPATKVIISLALSVSGLDTFYDLASLVTGRDPLTGQQLTSQELFITWLALSLPLVSASQLRMVDDYVDFAGDVGRAASRGCSFSAETEVTTEDGQQAIGEIDVGERVLAWDEATGAAGYYTVTATMAHVDPVVVHLTISGETIETTPEHPFYELDTLLWLVVETSGHWTPAGELHVGDQIRQADGTTGVVQAILFEATPQVMYNLTVAVAHTFFVGDGEWLVHNVCRLTGSSYLSEARSGISPRLQDSIVAAIHAHGDRRLLAAFRGSEPGSYIWHGSVRAKPMGASNLWEGDAGLRFGRFRDGTMGYYASDLDGAWALTGAGARIKDDQLLDPEGLYSAINKLYNVDIIQHGAHMNYILDGLKGEPLSPQRLGKALSYLSDQVYIFGYNGFVGSGTMRNTFYQYFIPR